MRPTPNAGLDRVRDFNLRPRDATPFSAYSLHDREQHMSDAANEIADMATAIAEPRAAAQRESDQPIQATLEVGEIAAGIAGRGGGRPTGRANRGDCAAGGAERAEPRTRRPSPSHRPAGNRLRAAGRARRGTERLDEAWSDGKTNILSLVAEGGAGKSALVNEWLTRLQADGYRGAERVLGWSFYSQGSKERATAAEEFLNWALAKLGVKLESTSAIAKGEAIAEALMRRRALLVLDGVEPLAAWAGTASGRTQGPGPARAVCAVSPPRRRERLTALSC